MIKYIFSSFSIVDDVFIDSQWQEWYIIALSVVTYIGVHHKNITIHTNLAAGVTGGRTKPSTDRMW